jgi:hypothetical protein
MHIDLSQQRQTVTRLPLDRSNCGTRSLSAGFIASTAAGTLGMIGSPQLAFGFSGLIAAAAILLLLFQPISKAVRFSS